MAVLTHLIVIPALIVTGAVVSVIWMSWRGRSVSLDRGQILTAGLAFWFSVYLLIGFYNLIFGSALEP